ncbi:LOW QUALITY PROTEIN: hypothetical protein V1477_012959 [Vespula maculifrons]|uniref:Uncharacterized protein n=1 Tax=Vespula maculifrons TaxID=7453 RepID=A0ABD2BV32_VESMC
MGHLAYRSNGGGHSVTKGWWSNPKHLCLCYSNATFCSRYLLNGTWSCKLLVDKLLKLVKAIDKKLENLRNCVPSFTREI